MATRRSGGGRGARDREPLPRSVQISKKLSWLLRHGAADEGLQLDDGGFANLKDVLNNRKLRGYKATLDEVREIVQDNDKQRFTLKPKSTDAAPGDESAGVPNEQLASLSLSTSNNPADYLIRANQGHSLKVESEGLLQPILASQDLPDTVVHGTTHAAWPLVVASGGLKPMARNHVHFARGLPAGFKSLVEAEVGKGPEQADAPPVISGMRKTSTILIFVDMGRAMAAGVKFWMSDNGVILSEGDENGVVPLEFFKRVEDRTGEGILVDDGRVLKEAPAQWSKRKH